VIRHSIDLTVLAGVAVLAIALQLTDPHVVLVRTLVTLPLVLALPGYALTATVFPRHSLSVVEQVVLSIGLSLGLAALGGPLLNWTPSGLSPLAWSVFLGGITLAASATAALRRARTRSDGGARTQWRLHYSHAYVAGAAAALVTLLAVSIAVTSAAAKPGDAFTELWLVPSPQETIARVGIENHESRLMSYRLIVTESDDRQLGDWTGIQLQPGEQWNQQLTLSPSAGADSLDAALYVDGSPQAYRHVFARLDAPTGRP